ncbi:hypothetical protein V8C34DRAFT_201454 [Trichoderma compactum]
MSNFEAFGIVLRAIPILISGAELCREGYDKGRLAFRRRQYVETLSRALQMQQRIVLETVRLIITRSGYSFDERVLNEGPIAYFQNTDIQTSVEAFLGDENYKTLTASLQDMQTTLKEVTKLLDSLIPPHKDRPYDLMGIIEANRMAEKHKLDLLPRLKAAFMSNEINETVSELDKATDRLSTFSHIVLLNRDGPISSHPSSNTEKLAKTFRRIRDSSRKLYSALCRCCTGPCHNEHDVHVLLEDRIDVASESLSSKTESSTKNEATLSFQLIFGARLDAPIQTKRYELSVKCTQEDEHGDWFPALDSKSLRVNFCEPESVKPNDPNYTRPEFVPVDDFCTAIVSAHENAQHVAFILHASSRIGVVTAKEKTIMQKTGCQTISLKDILSGSSNSYGARLHLQSSMLLASKLASSLLQFSQTQWFGQVWSKDSIFFLSHPLSDGTMPIADINRPFVYAKMKGMEVNKMKATEPVSVLLELGILLLEIWHHTGLENQFTQSVKQASGDYFSRLPLAAKWLHDTRRYNPLPLMYDDAVRYCIYGAANNDWTDWNAKELWSEICQKVIKPLSENCEQWRKRTVAY